MDGASESAIWTAARTDRFAHRYQTSIGTMINTESVRMAKVNPATSIPAAGYPKRMRTNPRKAIVSTSGSEKSSLVYGHQVVARPIIRTVAQTSREE